MVLQTEKRPTHAYIDLDALAFNFRSAKQFIGTDLAYMAVVKADAYGHGALQCALRLEAEGVDWFGVAIPEEGVELRIGGIMAPILCLGSFWPGQEEQLATHNLTPAVYSLNTAGTLNSYAEANGLTFNIHVKIDTGMGRVGMAYTDAQAFANSLNALRSLRVSGLLTHFASAEDPKQNEFTNTQIERFASACEAFRGAGHAPTVIDLANSPAAIAHPAARGNMVRLGGALYGLLDDIMPNATEMPALKPVLSLRSRIAQIRDVPAGESLGYGRTFFTKRDSRIAVVPIGYADGYPRALSNIGTASVNGRSVPVVGRISMDWTLFDVTDVEGVAIDTEITLIGEGVSAADIAGLTGTIGYEITCGLTKRVPRVYLDREAEPNRSVGTGG